MPTEPYRFIAPRSTASCCPTVIGWASAKLETRRASSIAGDSPRSQARRPGLLDRRQPLQLSATNPVVFRVSAASARGGIRRDRCLRVDGEPVASRESPTFDRWARTLEPAGSARLQEPAQDARFLAPRYGFLAGDQRGRSESLLSRITREIGRSLAKTDVKPELTIRHFRVSRKDKAVLVVRSRNGKLDRSAGD